MHKAESSADDARGNSHEAPNVSEGADEHENELDSKETIDTGEECVDGENEARVADGEIDQGNSADLSVESTQERVRSCWLLTCTLYLCIPVCVFIT